MIPNLPLYISIVFLLTTILLFLLFTWVYKGSSNYSPKTAAIILLLQFIWLIVQGSLALSEVYNSGLDVSPPRLLVFGILPPMLVIIYLLLSKQGGVWINSLPLERLVWLSIVRIPVEIGLFRLYIHGAVPRLMTFEGGNLDIISGLTVPVIAYYGFSKGVFGKKVILGWNILCLGLLANIVIRAILSAPLPFQELAFDQPNIAILHFPFIWLPVYIVPVVLFGMLASIRKLSK